MKARVKSTGEIIEVRFTKLDSGYGIEEYTDSKGKEWQFYELELLSESATIEGWVARDKDNRLRLHYTMPQRASGCYWQGGFKSSYLPDDLFPSVTWESEPLKCRITITPIDE